MLVGREPVVREFERALDGVGHGGWAVVLRGDPGVGKSALLGRIEAVASRRNVRVLRTSGAPSEARMPYAGLQRLLGPHLDRIAHLSRPQATALAAAIGLADDDESPPDAFKVALGALNVLAEVAATTPLLLVLEDGHWLDHDSSEALSFIARRVQLEPIVVVCALRTGHPSPWDQAALPEIVLPPLAATHAEELLDSSAPGLAPDLRQTVLEIAGGNPLALLELPKAFGAGSDLESAQAPVPVTQALKEAFLSRAAQLSPGAGKVLLVSALDEHGRPEVLTAVASRVAGEPVTDTHLVEAENAGLIVLTDTGIRFRHPLVAAAVTQQTTAAERRAVYAALAETYVDDPDRRAWHRAGACTGPDADVAVDLAAAAQRALSRGAPAVAAVALERAAELTADEGARAELLLQAASTELDLGRSDLALKMLGQARTLDMTPPDAAWLSLLLEAADDERWSDPDRISTFARVAAEMIEAWEPARALQCLLTVAQGCWHTSPGQETLDLVVRTARRMPLPAESPALMAILGCTDPVGQGEALNRQLRDGAAEEGAHPVALHLIGTAATTVWAFDVAIRHLTAAIDGLRREERLGLLAQALLSQSWAALHVGKIDVARSSAEEATRLARDTGQRIWGISADIVLATVAGEQGNMLSSARITQQAEAELINLGSHPLLAQIAFARGRTAVAHQHYADGFEHLSQLLDPTDSIHQPHVASWAFADFIEAADATGRHSAAREAMARLEVLNALTDGPLLAAELAYVRPLLADEQLAEKLFRYALTTTLSRWPCYQTRAFLAYGRWLRRQRRVSESRAPLRTARDRADALGLAGLAELARQELRAAGEASTERRPLAWEALTPQESQIAQLAAQGLSNKEIGQRLFLSHRTVASHLYRIFPKLGISTRAQLAQACAGQSSGHATDNAAAAVIT